MFKSIIRYALGTMRKGIRVGVYTLIILHTLTDAWMAALTMTTSVLSESGAAQGLVNIYLFIQNFEYAILRIASKPTAPNNVIAAGELHGTTVLVAINVWTVILAVIGWAFWPVLNKDNKANERINNLRLSLWTYIAYGVVLWLVTTFWLASVGGPLLLSAGIALCAVMPIVWITTVFTGAGAHYGHLVSNYFHNNPRNGRRITVIASIILASALLSGFYISTGNILITSIIAIVVTTPVLLWGLNLTRKR